MSKKILVVDDDPVAGTLMESRLGRSGYTVVRALDGADGLTKAHLERPDLIVLDVEMPHMNGYTFVHEVKQIESLKNIPIVVLTSHEENKPIFMRRGISNYFIKPVNFDMFLEKVSLLLGGV